VLLRRSGFVNLGLLIFNMLPIYPLDGGQILGPALVCGGTCPQSDGGTIIGFLGVAGFIILALWMHSVWFGVLSAFMGMNCWSGLRQAQALSRLEKLPRRDGYACPRCKTAPPVGDVWKCGSASSPSTRFRARPFVRTAEPSLP